jgi:hypothetical protein
MTTSTIDRVSPLDLIELLGTMIRDAVHYDGRDRDLENLRKVYALNKAQDARWTEFLELWASETKSSRCAGAARSILKNHYELQAEQAHQNFQATRPVHTPVTEDGMYLTADSEIFKVQWNRASGSGHRLYAKQMVGYGAAGRVVQFTKANAEAQDGLEIVFEYAPGAMRQLTAAEKMTIEDAKAFGALYGTCCVCGRTLTDEKSIAAGIGPVCAGKNFG